MNPPPFSVHRLQPGLPGYLILFAPPAFAPQRQGHASRALSPPAFLLISTHFTASPGVPVTPHALEPGIFGRRFDGKRRDSTTDLPSRLRALYAQ